MGCLRTFLSTAASGLAVLALGACAASPAASPARMADAPTTQCIAELTAFAQVASKRPSRVSSGAFANSDTLVLMESPSRDAEGNLREGNIVSLPTDTYKLSIEGRQCIITHMGSRMRKVLSSCSCTSFK
jgi:hypothetical protein